MIGQYFLPVLVSCPFNFLLFSFYSVENITFSLLELLDLIQVHFLILVSKSTKLLPVLSFHIKLYPFAFKLLQALDFTLKV